MEQHFCIKWMRKEERIMRIAFLTLGCKVNSYETDKMKNKFIEAGDYIVSFEEEADIYLVNTCTVTNIADRKSRQMLHRAKKKNPQALHWQKMSRMKAWICLYRMTKRTPL